LQQKVAEQAAAGTSLRRALALVIPAFVLAGCATSDGPEPMLPSGTVSIESKIHPTEGVAMTSVTNTSKIAGDAGMKGGATVGAAASLVCGPGVFFCLPFFAVSGAFLGWTAGNVAAAVGDAFDLFPPEVAGRIEHVLVDIRRRRDFFDELREAVSEAVPETRQADASAADTNVYVGPEGVHFLQDEPNMFALRMVGSTYVEERAGGVSQQGESREYEYVTAEMPVDFWLSDGGAPFDRAFTEGVEKIALMMAWDLVGQRAE
jgi:hypothetical protein